MLDILFLCLTIFVIATSLLPLLPFDKWWIRGFDFPRLQIIAAAALVIVLGIINKQYANTSGMLLLATLTLCLLYQSYMIYPYTPFASKQVKGHKDTRDLDSISLLCINVLMDNRSFEKVRTMIHEADADIILAVETDQRWVNELRELEDSHPHTILEPLDNYYGIALYSRKPLKNPTLKFLVEDDIPSVHFEVELDSGITVDIHGLHPRPPFPTESNQSTERDAELLIVGKKIDRNNNPTIVMGDMNDVAWSSTNYLFQKISGLLDPRVGRGFFNTFHAKYPFLRFPLDHFFHSRHFCLVDYKRLSHVGSDHFPVYIELNYELNASANQEEPEADESEEENAEEKIKDGI